MCVFNRSLIIAILSVWFLPGTSWSAPNYIGPKDVRQILMTMEALLPTDRKSAVFSPEATGLINRVPSVREIKDIGPLFFGPVYDLSYLHCEGRVQAELAGDQSIVLLSVLSKEDLKSLDTMSVVPPEISEKLSVGLGILLDQFWSIEWSQGQLQKSVDYLSKAFELAPAEALPSRGVFLLTGVCATSLFQPGLYLR